MPPKRLTPNEYTVGWICALSIELFVAAEMFDEEYQHLPQDSTDNNSYSFGRIGEHNVVVAHLWHVREQEISSATAVASQMKTRFPSIRFGLMVGIGGGVPSAEADIRLGDVVISQPFDKHRGAVQFDFEKTGPKERFTQTGSPNEPPAFLLAALAQLRSNYIRQGVKLSEHLSLLDYLPEFAY
jgi:nucleoside phosphorylase